MKSYPVIAFANAMVGREFSWGQCCCNTVTLKFLDMIMEGHPDYTSITEEVVGKFDTRESAYKFYKDFSKTRFSGDKYLMSFCDKNPEKPQFQIGDVITRSTGLLVESHICVGAKSLSVDPKEGVVLVSTVELFKLEDIDIYRPRL